MSHKVNSSTVVSRIVSVLSLDSFFASSFVKEFWLLTGNTVPPAPSSPNHWIKEYISQFPWKLDMTKGLILTCEKYCGISGRLQFKGSWFSQEALLLLHFLLWPASQTWLWCSCSHPGPSSWTCEEYLYGYSKKTGAWIPDDTRYSIMNPKSLPLNLSYMSKKETPFFFKSYFGFFCYPQPSQFLTDRKIFIQMLKTYFC